MNFSARKARRKWPCGGFGCGKRLMVTAAALLCLQTAPAMARKPGVWPQNPLSDLFREPTSRPKRRAAVPVVVSVPLPKPRPAEAPVVEPEKPTPEASKPPQPAKPVVEEVAPKPPPPSACRLALTETIAIAPSIPDIYGAGGCGGEDLVRLEAIVLPDNRRVAVKPAAILRCTMASAVADWLRADMAPLAAGLGAALSELDNFDSFECRGRNRVVGAKLSEHGRANALDIRALKLADGRSISLTDRTVPRETRESVLRSVCARFSTVLGPGSDWYHEDHIHLDLMERRGNYRICQWNVYDPMPAIAPLLPADRPEDAPPREVAEKPDALKQDSSKPDAAKPDASEPKATPSPETRKPTKKRRRTGAFELRR